MVNNHAWKLGLVMPRQAIAHQGIICHGSWVIYVQLISTVDIGHVRHLGTCLHISVNTLKALSLHMS